MRNLDDGCSLGIECFEQLHDFFALARVEIACRFICQDQLGLGDDGASDADQLLLATGKLIRVEVFFSDDLESIKGIGDDSLAFTSFNISAREKS